MACSDPECTDKMCFIEIDSVYVEIDKMLEDSGASLKSREVLHDAYEKALDSTGKWPRPFAIECGPRDNT